MTKARDLGDFISDGTIAETVTADGLNLGDNEQLRIEVLEAKLNSKEITDAK